MLLAALLLEISSFCVLPARYRNTQLWGNPNHEKNNTRGDHQAGCFRSKENISKISKENDHIEDYQTPKQESSTNKTVNKITQRYKKHKHEPQLALYILSLITDK
jgi:hypothetical protein